MLVCRPGDTRCQNLRRYYQTDFRRPSPYDRQPVVDDAKRVHNPVRETAKKPPTAIQPSTNTPQGIIRPLKQMSKLTPSQIEKGRMVAAAYEMDHKINQEMKYTGKEIATKNILRRDSNNVLRKTELEGWDAIKNISDKQYLVLEKGSDVKIVFRGRAGNNPVDNVHVGDSLKGKTRNYGYLDELMGEIVASRPHSDIEVISYSNGGPKGLYLAEKYGVSHYTIDPVIGPKEIALLTSRDNTSAKLEIVRTNRPALASGAGTTLQQVISGGNPKNTKIINVEPVKTGSFTNPLEKIIDGHDLSHYASMDDELSIIPEHERGRIGLIGRNALGSVVSGVVPAALASVLVENFTPNAPHEVKLTEISSATAGLTKVVSPLVGAGGVSAASLALPLFTSFEAADKTGQLIDYIIPDDLHGTIPHEVIKGSISGASGGAGFGVMSAAQSAAATVISSTATTAEGVEMVALGAAAAEEVGVLGAAALGAETGAAITAELGPLALGGAAIGGAIGLGIGLFGGTNKPQVMDDTPTFLKDRLIKTSDQMVADDDRQQAGETDMREEEEARYEKLMRQGDLNDKDQQFLEFLQNKKGYPK